MNEDCDAIEPENCAEHGDEARRQNCSICQQNPAVCSRHKPLDGDWLAYGKALSADVEAFRKALLEQATAPKRDIYAYFRATRPENFGTYIGPVFDKDKLFKFLVVAVCPVVCKGYRVPETTDANGYKSDDWHELCENKAHRAMKELGYE
jgi:hypothetical protein